MAALAVRSTLSAVAAGRLRGCQELPRNLQGKHTKNSNNSSVSQIDLQDKLFEIARE